MPAPAVAPLFSDWTMEFPYKHSTGETIGRFLAGLKEQKTIWGQRVPGQGVVVPPLGYSEIDASEGGEWVAVKDTGTVTAVAVVHEPLEGLHPSTTPFAYVLVQARRRRHGAGPRRQGRSDRLKVGARVQAEWAPDDERMGTMRDIAGFRLVG